MHAGLLVSLLVLLTTVFVVSAAANSTSYNFTGTLMSLNGIGQQQLSGSVVWNSSLGVATSSSLGLSNTTGPNFVHLLAPYSGTHSPVQARGGR